MRRSLPLIVCTATLLASLPALAGTTQSHPSAKSAAARRHTSKSLSPHSSAALHRSSLNKGSHSEAAHNTKNPHGHLAQVAMDPDRATQIQQALIKGGYLTGEPTGKWDAASVAAMQKLQSDNGWQTKIMPDSRALIKLGLGPGADANVASATPGGSAAQ
jgi:hypothetical protein